MATEQQLEKTHAIWSVEVSFMQPDRHWVGHGKGQVTYWREVTFSHTLIAPVQQQAAQAAIVEWLDRMFKKHQKTLPSGKLYELRFIGEPARFSAVLDQG